MGHFHKTYAVFAMLRDKDITAVARAVAPKVDVWLVAGIKAPRGASADEVVHALEAAGVIPGDRRAEGEAQEQEDRGARSETIRCFPSPAEAYTYACEQAGINDRICVFGSFHTVAEALQRHKTVVRS